MGEVIEVTRTDRVFNGFMGWLARHGIGVAGARELSTIGRTSGEPRTTPVNPFVIGGVTYLVAPRGQTQWVRNARVNPEVTLRVGRHTTGYAAVEVTDEPTKVVALRAYLAKWAWEVGRFFPELGKNPSEEAFLAAAISRPVFRLDPLG